MSGMYLQPYMVKEWFKGQVRCRIVATPFHLFVTKQTHEGLIHDRIGQEVWYSMYEGEKEVRRLKSITLNKE